MPPQDPEQPQMPEPPQFPQQSPAPQQQPVQPQQPTWAPQPMQYTSPPTKKRFPIWLILVSLLGVVVIAFVGLLVILVVIASSATKAPQKVSDQFVNDVQSGDASAAYMLTSKTFQQATTEAQLDTMIQQVGPGLQGQEKTTGHALNKSTGIPETAVIVYSLKTSAGTKYIKTELQKSGDNWQIVNFRSSSSSLDTAVE